MALDPKPNRRPIAVVLVAISLVMAVIWLRCPTFGFNFWNVDEAIHAAARKSALFSGLLLACSFLFKQSALLDFAAPHFLLTPLAKRCFTPGTL